MDNKRLNGEEVPEIKQGEIDAWKRGKDDAMRNKLLTASQQLGPKRAVALIKAFCDVPDVHFLSTRFDVGVEEVRRVLNAFSINSVEDARELVNGGIIAELDAEEEANRRDQEAQSKADHAEAQQRLDEQEAASAAEEPSQEEQDQKLAQARADAQRKNKEDHLRQLLSEGLDPVTGKSKSTFRVPVGRATEFRRMIPHGVYQLQRAFGGSKADIVSEIKRLAPEYDVDMLRP